MKGQAILKVSPELLVEMLKGFETGFNGKYEVVQDGLPKDVKLVEVCIEDMSRHPAHYMPGIFLKLESDSYPAPEPGHLLPVLSCPVFSAVREDRLLDVLKDANDLCRSAHSVAVREGRDTNWDALTKKLKNGLKKQHPIIFGRELKESKELDLPVVGGRDTRNTRGSFIPK